MAFFRAGKHYNQRAFIAANQSGKTVACAIEMYLHLTGDYPDWWEGRRFNKPIRAWAAGISAQKVRDTMQMYLLGNPYNIGTGFIPGDRIIGTTPSSSNIQGCKMDVFVKHRTGGQSWLTFKSYSDGRGKFQGDVVDAIWLDEEDPAGQGIYSECITRFATNDGIIFCSFTPLYSLSDVVISFLPDLQFPDGGYGPTSKYKFVCNATWDDVPHLTEEKKQELLESYMPHERDARTKGIPGLGAGLIYPVSLDTITFRPNKELIDSLRDLPRAYAMDIAYTSGVTAAVWGVYDEVIDTWWIYDEYYCSGMPPVVHAAGIMAKGSWIEGVIDPSADRQVKAGDDLRIIEEYRNRGLILTKAKNTLLAGIEEVYNRMVTGRIRISVKCEKLLWELKQYRRDDKGKIVDVKDHACDCLRYIVMSGKEVLSFEPLNDNDEDESYREYQLNASKDKYTGY